MKILVRKHSSFDEAFSNDIPALRAALNSAGYDAAPEDIQWAWKQHSRDWGVVWLIVDEDADTIVKYLLEYLV